MMKADDNGIPLEYEDYKEIVRRFLALRGLRPTATAEGFIRESFNLRLPPGNCGLELNETIAPDPESIGGVEKIP